MNAFEQAEKLAEETAQNLYKEYLASEIARIKDEASEAAYRLGQSDESLKSLKEYTFEQFKRSNTYRHMMAQKRVY